MEDSSSFIVVFLHTYQSEVVKHHICKDLRESVGLGSPPVIFTTNGSESINALIKRKVNHKESDWPQFTNNATTPAPGSPKKSCMVISYFQVAPHLVQSKSNGQYVRDSNCQQWASSQICSHVLATVKYNNELCCFLEWYTMYAESPNISTLALSSLPRERGRKGGRAKRQRNRNSHPLVDNVTVRPGMQSSFHGVTCGAVVNVTSATGTVDFHNNEVRNFTEPSNSLLYPNTSGPPPLMRLSTASQVGNGLLLRQAAVVVLSSLKLLQETYGYVKAVEEAFNFPMVQSHHLLLIW